MKTRIGKNKPVAKVKFKAKVKVTTRDSTNNEDGRRRWREEGTCLGKVDGQEGKYLPTPMTTTAYYWLPLSVERGH